MFLSEVCELAVQVMKDGNCCYGPHLIAKSSGCRISIAIKYLSFVFFSKLEVDKKHGALAHAVLRNHAERILMILVSRVNSEKHESQRSPSL